MNRRSAPRLPLAPLAVAACLALTSCAHHGETARTSPRPASPPATGSLAEVECGGSTPAALRAELAEAPDPGYEAPAEWLAEAGPEAAPGWPDDLAEIVYVDRFGNAMSGLRTGSVAADAILRVNGQAVRPARVFGDAPAGAPFWYGNSCGLVEIAVPNGDAAAMLDIRTGSAFGIEKPD